LSSRRALNPDTFEYLPGKDEEDMKAFRDGGVKWIDSILAKGESRSLWEAVTLSKMKADVDDQVDKGSRDSYWYKYVDGGLQMARLIKEKAKLSARKV
jgi:hypothetical protein